MLRRKLDNASGDFVVVVEFAGVDVLKYHRPCKGREREEDVAHVGQRIGAAQPVNAEFPGAGVLMDREHFPVVARLDFAAAGPLNHVNADFVVFVQHFVVLSALVTSGAG